MYKQGVPSSKMFLYAFCGDLGLLCFLHSLGRHVFDILRNVSVTHSQEIVIGLISTSVFIIGSSGDKKGKKASFEGCAF